MCLLPTSRMACRFDASLCSPTALEIPAVCFVLPSEVSAVCLLLFASWHQLASPGCKAGTPFLGKNEHTHTSGAECPLECSIYVTCGFGLQFRLRSVYTGLYVGATGEKQGCVEASSSSPTDGGVLHLRALPTQVASTK